MQYFARPSLDGQKFQLLNEHINNVVEYAAIFGSRNNLTAICCLLAYLHDMGKYSPEFQKYIREVAKNIQNGERSSSPIIDHGSYGAAYIYACIQPRIEKQNPNTKIKNIIPYFLDFLAMCIAYHHGGLDDYLSIETIKSPIKGRLQSFIDETNEQTSLTKIKSSFFADCINQYELNKLEDEAIDEFLALFERISNAPHSVENRKANQRNYDVQLILKFAYSCLIDADRLDAYNYSAIKPLVPEVSIVSDLDGYIEKLEEKLKFFRNEEPDSISGKLISELRAAISDECSSAAKRETGTYTLTVPTGGGKTFASLRFALEHARYHADSETEKTQLIYVLPYTTIIEQNADEIRKTLSCSTNLLEHHSNVNYLDDEYDEEYKLLTERWDVPIIFTTQVQFFNTLIQGKSNSIRKLHTLANSIIIIDEIQTIPLKCTYMANAAFNTLSRHLNSTVILCTATQPNLKELEVPVLLKDPGELTRDPAESARAFRRMKIVDATKTAGDNCDEFVNWMSDLLLKEESILVVMNTKNGVKSVFDKLKEQNLKHSIYYLTTYLCPAHRKTRIAEIKEKLEFGIPLIVVSTNLIECGVDLSFRYVIRNLAGLQSIIQSSGRGNRHGEHSLSQTYVVDIQESVSALKELIVGQQCTMRLLSAFGQRPEDYDNSLLSQKAIDIYYDIFSEEARIKEKMGYPIKSMSRNIPLQAYDLLAERDVNHKKLAWSKFELTYSYPFRFISQHFQVIDQNTSGIVVPFNKEAINLQGLLMSQNLPLDNKRKIFREIQQYTVNVYQSDLIRLLKDGYVRLVPWTKDLYILREAAYSDDFGVHEEGSMNCAVY